MARIVASNDDDDDDTYSMELTSVQEPTLGQLFKNFHDDESPVHESPSNSGYDNALTTVPFVLSFENLTYNVSIRHKLDFRNLFPSRKKKTEDDPEIARTGQEPKPNTKTLLNNISGETRDGEIMAVLGASGSGKSTLIDALANRISKESLKGDVKLNGEALQSRTLKVISAYVMQDDLLFPMLTVEETLMFAAEFRLPRNLPKHKKKLRVRALIDQLGIKNASSTIIGDEGHRGISGGERRRVSIGIDIIHDPIVLFLDEPTSGLDSTSAFMVVKVLKRIAASGSIVIMSIHQPSHRVLGLLDRLIMLSRGDTVFSGTPESLPRFFEEFGCPIPENENLTEFALDLIRELEGSDKGNGGLVEFNRNWQLNRRETPPLAPPCTKLTLKEAIAASIRRGKLVSGVESTHNDGSAVTTSATAAISTLAVRETVWKSISARISRGKLFRGGESTQNEGSATVTTSAAAIETLAVPDFANPTWIEIKTLSKRSILNFRRQPEIFGVRIATVVITGLILATVFWRLDDSPRGVQERLGFFAFAMSTMFYTCTDALPVFLQERYIFMRETAYNAYRRSSYVVSHAVVTFPSLVFLSLAFSTTTFWAVGLSGGPMGFLFYNLIILASFWAGSSFVTFISGVVPHVMLGYTIVVAILAYFLLLSGFFINRNRIPDYWIWFHYMSLVKYPYEAVLQNEFSDATRCFVRGVQTFENTPLGVLPEPMKLKLLETISESLGIAISSSTCLTNGEDILKHQGITQLGKWYCLLVTVGFGFFFRVLFYLSLLLGSKNKRR